MTIWAFPSPCGGKPLEIAADPPRCKLHGKRVLSSFLLLLLFLLLEDLAIAQPFPQQATTASQTTTPSSHKTKSPCSAASSLHAPPSP